MTDLASHRGSESSRNAPTTAEEFLAGIPSARTRKGLFGFSGRTRKPKASVMELEAAANLATLGNEWTVLRAIDFDQRYGTRLGADFVVVGPAGIFTISTGIKPGAKIWVDERVLWVNGRITNDVEKARISALDVSTKFVLASGEIVNVTPIIAMSNPASVDFGGDASRRVIALPTDVLAQWLSECSRAYSGEAVAFFSMVAEERDTWAVAA